jgi:rubrerythrin
LEALKLLLGNRTTAENLTEALEGERHESEEMYPTFAREAEVEGHTQAEVLFTQISKIEEEHHARFQKLLAMVEAGTVFKREQPIKWKCSICGYTYDGLEPPNRCPYCKSAKEYYEPANLDV